MLDDVEHSSISNPINGAQLADARHLAAADGIFSAVITSPPYPNRHDYTRIFGVELMYGFLDWEGTRAVRYQSFHSHPEARPTRPDSHEYRHPVLLRSCLDAIGRHSANPRLMRMLNGYFLDMFCCLKEMHRVCVGGARMALVLGNAQYYGQPLPVDEVTAQIGEMVGLRCVEIIVARIRGNSAQQMKLYGRRPSRESVVVFEKVT